MAANRTMPYGTGFDDNPIRISGEMKLLEELRDRLNSSLNELSARNEVDTKEKARLREEGYKLLEITQKSLLRRQIMIRVDSLDRERVLLSALNEKHYELSRLSADFISGRSRESNRKYTLAAPTHGKPKTGNELHEELKRVREQIYRTIASEGEEENKK